MFKNLRGIFRKKSSTEEFINRRFNIKINDFSFYDEALTHKSISEDKNNNYERLEFLGDSILGSVISHILYTKFDRLEEGDLTRFKAKIVSRKSLNAIGKSLDLQSIVKIDKSIDITHTSILGNVFEALIGAVYLDLGYTQTFKVIAGILDHQIDFKTIHKIDLNYKGILIEYCHKHGKQLKFRTSSDRDENGDYEANIVLDNNAFTNGIGRSKKIAEQNASKEACEKLQLLKEI
ncbi:MAG: ribonuclease III [Flavobacteriales bacterium]|nr:ribonuclease III [Flavobacteriales bacterium]